MKLFRTIASVVSLSVLSAFLLTGCVTESASSGGGASAATAPPPASLVPELIRAGENLTVTFSDLPPTANIPDFRDRVKDDGSIILPLGVKVDAAGKTAGQLQQAIEAAYVPRYFKRLTVSVKNEERFFYVGGEVRQPTRQPYAGAGLTVLQAVASAGGFTEFGDKKRVTLRRVNGQQYVINCVRALKDHNLDLPVYPGDSIDVPKRAW